MKSAVLSTIKSLPVLFGVTPWLFIIAAYAAAFPHFWARGAW
jgi:hypothetical protein